MALLKSGRLSKADITDSPDLETLLASNSGTSVRLANDVDLETLAPRLSGLKTIEVEFPGYADGRGFSIARQLRRRYGFQGELVATGPLIPDQYAYLLQCGFDSVKVDDAVFERQGEDDWRNALDAFDLTYQRGYVIANGPSMNVLAARRAKRSDDLSAQYEGYDARRALEQAISHDYNGQIVLASSMGIDSAVLLHMVSEIDNRLPVLFLETGKHFKETLAYRDQLVARFGLTNFQSILPDATQLAEEDPDGILNQSDKDSCCNLRKVRPLDREITKYTARITGRKRYQTPERANMAILETGGRQVKLNPLASWTAKDVTSYMRLHDLPPHPLLALGFLSVGCEPCTTRVAEGEDPRAGRWRNSSKTECGIHYINGKWVPIEAERGTHEVF